MERASKISRNPTSPAPQKFCAVRFHNFLFSGRSFVGVGRVDLGDGRSLSPRPPTTPRKFSKKIEIFGQKIFFLKSPQMVGNHPKRYFCDVFSSKTLFFVIFGSLGPAPKPRQGGGPSPVASPPGGSRVEVSFFFSNFLVQIILF